MPAPAGATQHELFGSLDDAAAPSLALAMALSEAAGERPWLWVQDRASQAARGRPYLPGLPAALRHGLLHVTARRAEDALFALEEGARCRDLAFVIGEIARDPRALDFTASRRLAVASERHGVPLYLIRGDGTATLSAARRRWRVAARPSARSHWDARAPGRASWQAELFRARGMSPGSWVIEGQDDGTIIATATHAGDLVADAGDRPLAAAHAG